MSDNEYAEIERSINRVLANLTDLGDAPVVSVIRIHIEDYLNAARSSKALARAEGNHHHLDSARCSIGAAIGLIELASELIAAGYTAPSELGHFD